MTTRLCLKVPQATSCTTTHIDVGVGAAATISLFFQVPSDIPISLRRFHRNSARVLTSVVGVD